MDANSSRFAFLRSAPAAIASILLIAQVGVFYGMPRQENIPADPNLSSLPDTLNNWHKVAETEIEREILDLLKADRTLNRVYEDTAQHRNVTLFVAFFKTQRAGVSPHSPKVCLPGSGWVPLNSSTISVSVPDAVQPITINRYTVARGEYRSVVLYWYQSHNRVTANEYAAKLYVMLDGLRYRRSDTSLVRVVIPVPSGKNEADAQQIGEDFIRAFFNPLRSRLPA